MGHVVNPISFRLTKTKFCFNSWVSTSKLRYSPLFLNDISLNKFIQWYITTFNTLLLNANLLLNNFNIIRANKTMLININFTEIVEYKKKKKRKKRKKLFKKKTFKKKKKKKKYSVLLYYLRYKKYNLVNYCFNSWLVKKKVNSIRSSKVSKFKNLMNFLDKYNNNTYLHIYKNNIMLHKKYYSKMLNNLKNWLLFKNKRQKKPPLTVFLKLFKLRLNKILNFFFTASSKNFQINIFLLKNLQYTNILTKFVQTKLNQGFMLKYLIKKLNYKLNAANNNIIGYKLYYSGRSSKKLRNLPEMWCNGYLGLSNPLVPLEYSQSALWTKKGIVGLKIWLLKKKKINNVF